MMTVMTNIFLTGSICLDDIPQELIQVSEKNGKRYLNIKVSCMSHVSEYGTTHYISCKPKDAKDGVNYTIGYLKEHGLNNPF